MRDYTKSLIATHFAVFLFDEIPNLRTIAGGIIILSTAIIATYQSKQEHVGDVNS